MPLRWKTFDRYLFFIFHKVLSVITVFVAFLKITSFVLQRKYKIKFCCFALHIIGPLQPVNVDVPRIPFIQDLMGPVPSATTDFHEMQWENIHTVTRKLEANSGKLQKPSIHLYCRLLLSSLLLHSIGK